MEVTLIRDKLQHWPISKTTGIVKADSLQGLRTKITKNVCGGFGLDQGAAHSEKQIRDSKIPKKADEAMISMFTSSSHAQAVDSLPKSERSPSDPDGRRLAKEVLTWRVQY